MERKNSKIKLILVDDHKMFRGGLKHVLEQIEYINIIGEASDGVEYLELLKTKQPDIVLMDIAMPCMNGIEATALSMKRYSNLKIIALTMFEDDKYYYDMVSAGAKGFVMKDANNEVLLHVINLLIQGESGFTEDILHKIVKSYTNYSSGNRRSGQIGFSDQEMNVLQLVCLGLSIDDIARKLKLSEESSQKVLNGMLEKTRSSNSFELFLFALENRLLE